MNCVKTEEEYSKSGKLVSRYDSKNGLKNGPCLMMFDNTHVRERSHYVNNFKYGNVVHFHKNGKKKCEYYCENDDTWCKSHNYDKKTGKEFGYHEDGELHYEKNFYKGLQLVTINLYNYI
jgi:antitoxin component YwqK of YwqJK toxin-antitoxin module